MIGFISRYEFQVVKVGGDGQQLATQQNVVKWKPPQEGFYKINSNAVIDVMDNLVGVRLVIRDYEGQVMGTSAQRLVAGYSPEIAEAVAILHSIIYVEESGFDEFVTFIWF
ncbi:hypothetical protein Q3G72_028680 [Acer saccharum]|nr:hypothetical protein Q3G72_028680 [Acer saccharum]